MITLPMMMIGGGIEGMALDYSYIMIIYPSASRISNDNVMYGTLDWVTGANTDIGTSKNLNIMTRTQINEKTQRYINFDAYRTDNSYTGNFVDFTCRKDIVMLPLGKYSITIYGDNTYYASLSPFLGYYSFKKGDKFALYCQPGASSVYTEWLYIFPVL